MTEQIYVQLLDEGLHVWRPAPAWKVAAHTYVVLRPDDYDAEIERWEFPPGSVVECERRDLSDGPATVAVRASEANRQTA